MHDDSTDLDVITAILDRDRDTAAVHRSTASIADLFEVPTSLQPASPFDLWNKYGRPALQTNGLTSESDFESKLIPRPDTLDGFTSTNLASAELCGSGIHLIDTDSFKSRQAACSTIENCSGWWRFSGIGYSRDRFEALVHTDYDHPKCGLMGMGHYLLLSRTGVQWLVIAKHMTWIS